MLPMLAKYLNANLLSLRGMQSMDANRMTCLYFLFTSFNLIAPSFDSTNEAT